MIALQINHTRIPQHPERISSYFRQEAGPLTIVTVSGILYNVGMAADPWFLGQLAQCLADIISHKRVFSDMLHLAVLYAAVTLFVQAMRFLKRFYVRRFANNVNRSMKHVLYCNLVSKSAAELSDESTGSLMTRAVSDVDACAEGMRKFTTELFDTGVVMIAYLALLFYYDWRLTLFACIFPPVAYFSADRLKGIVEKRTAESRESAGRLSSAALDRASGALTYRIAGCEASREASYETALADYEKTSIRANLWVNALQPLYQAVSMTGVLFIIWFGAANIRGTGWSSWNIAAFTTFLACFTKLAVKSSKAAKLFNAVQKAEVSWKRICPFMKPCAVTDALPPAKPASLSVSHLSFSYPGGPELLHDVSFQAEPGQIIGITGKVACGKSTLGRVFLCEYPYQGSIRFGGQELSSLSDEERSRILAWMGHQPDLLSDSAADNILLGSDADAEFYLKAVCLDREVEPGTQVGSSGICLSGGQQARVALARVLCSGRPLYLLDDPFSAVDRSTEQELLQSLRQLAPQSVILLISHRLGIFPSLDSILWMEDGTTVQGTHAELMAKCPDYASLYRAQTEGGTTNEA